MYEQGITCNGKKYIVFNEVDKIYDADESKKFLDDKKIYDIQEDGSKKYSYAYYSVDNNNENVKYEVANNAIFRYSNIGYYEDYKDNYKEDTSFKPEVLSKPLVNYYDDKIIYFDVPIEEAIHFYGYFDQIKLEDDRVIEVNNIPNVFVDSDN